MNNKSFVSHFRPKRSYAFFAKSELGSSKLDQIGLPRTRRPFTKKHKREFMVRKLSEKSKTLSFEKYSVYRHSLNYIQIRQAQQTFGTMVYPKLYLREKPSDIKKKVNRIKKKNSILSFDVTFNQLLFKSSHFYRLNSNRKLGYLYSTNLDKMSFLSSDLANLALSVKTYLFLKRKGIHKIGDLVIYSPEKLLRFLNKDRKMFAELQRTFLLQAVRENN